MTIRQKELARHALGLDESRQKRSYRNRYIASPVQRSAWAEWHNMVRDGLAVVRAWGDSSYREFKLTAKGAGLALNQNESLGFEDFPS